MSVVFKQIKVGPMENFVYVFGNAATGSGTVVDPGFERDRVLAELDALGLRPDFVLVTHGHFDHVTDVEPIRRETRAKVVAHPASATKPDVAVADGARVDLGGVDVLPVFTPGHEPTSVCYVVDGKWLLTGDTLFIGECGRTDLPGSDVDEMWRSLNERIPRLPANLVVCPGHDYGSAPTDTLGNQLATNYTLEKRSREEFREFMESP